MLEPESLFYESQRLRLHYTHWGNGSREPLLLVHGGRDHSRNWDAVAAGLVDDYDIYAPDLRGHGDSEWAMGSQYSLPEYTADIAMLVDIISPERPLTLIGHSLGGAIVLQYAGVYPDKARKVVAIEGLGPGVREPRPAHLRMRQFIGGLRDIEKRRLHTYPDVEAAARRMKEENPHLSDEMAFHLTKHGVRTVEDGRLTWKFDNFGRIQSPYDFMIADAREIWNQIRSPVLLVRGDKSWAADPEEDGKASAFHDYHSVQIKEAGHWVHHDQLEQFMRVVKDFLRA
jgi:pimeloyl-ACP methyl ester carboxylesterase